MWWSLLETPKLTYEKKEFWCQLGKKLIIPVKLSGCPTPKVNILDYGSFQGDIVCFLFGDIFIEVHVYV